MWKIDRLVNQWVLATAVGWLLGFVFLVLLAEAWRLTGGEAQFMVGVGMGAGVGLLQAKTIGGVIDTPRRWFWSSVVGMAIPFIAWDLGAGSGLVGGWALQPAIAIGALLVGILQAALLRNRYRRALWWIPACVLGWMAPAGLVAFEHPAVLLSVIVLGGLLLGAVTGLSLVWVVEGHPRTRS